MFPCRTNTSVNPTNVAEATAHAPPKYLKEIGPNDVLLGRGKPAIFNEGNIRFRRLVLSRKDEYVKTNIRQRKDAIARMIVVEIAKRTGRFIRKIESLVEAEKLGVPSGVVAWVPVDDETALLKVKQALRALTSNTSTNNQDPDNLSTSKKRSPPDDEPEELQESSTGTKRPAIEHDNSSDNHRGITRTFETEPTRDTHAAQSESTLSVIGQRTSGGAGEGQGPSRHDGHQALTQPPNSWYSLALTNKALQMQETEEDNAKLPGAMGTDQSSGPKTKSDGSSKAAETASVPKRNEGATANHLVQQSGSPSPDGVACTVVDTLIITILSLRGLPLLESTSSITLHNNSLQQQKQQQQQQQHEFPFTWLDFLWLLEKSVKDRYPNLAQPRSMFVSNTLPVARMAISLLQQFLRHKRSICHGQGPFVHLQGAEPILDWLELEITKWATVLGSVDTTAIGTTNEIDLLSPSAQQSMENAVFTSKDCNVLLKQVASLTRLRSIFIKPKLSLKDALVASISTTNGGALGQTQAQDLLELPILFSGGYDEVFLGPNRWMAAGGNAAPAVLGFGDVRVRIQRLAQSLHRRICE